MTVERAAQHALEFCRLNPKWQRFCDIQDTDALMITWDELPARFRRPWEQDYHHAAEDAWREFGNRPMRHRRGFVDELGRFHDSLLGVRLNIMTVVETGGPEGIYFRGGRSERSAIRGKPTKGTPHDPCPAT